MIRRIAYQAGPTKILKRWAALMPDGGLERCPFDDAPDGRGKVVFDDLGNAERAAALLATLPSPQRLAPYPCRVWDHVWHLSSRHDGIGPEHKSAVRPAHRERKPRALTYRIQLDLPETVRDE
jgi:hypothetical protein